MSYYCSEAERFVPLFTIESDSKTDNGKPIARSGRKATGLGTRGSKLAGLPKHAAPYVEVGDSVLLLRVTSLACLVLGSIPASRAEFLEPKFHSPCKRVPNVPPRKLLSLSHVPNQFVTERTRKPYPLVSKITSFSPTLCSGHF